MTWCGGRSRALRKPTAPCAPMGEYGYHGCRRIQRRRGNRTLASPKLDCRGRAAPASSSVGGVAANASRAGYVSRASPGCSVLGAGHRARGPGCVAPSDDVWRDQGPGGQRSGRSTIPGRGSCLFRVVHDRCKGAVEIQAQRHSVRLFHQPGGVPAECGARVGPRSPLVLQREGVPGPRVQVDGLIPDQDADRRRRTGA